MSLQQLTDEILPVVESELQRQVARLDGPETRPFRDMLAYHMGWIGEGAGPGATGKRVRPLLMLLVVSACGGQWLRAVAPAAAIELLHNFSLVHDDIQDNSTTRRGRVTVWKKVGLPMAVNVGDALFVIANLAVLDTATAHPPEIALQAAQALEEACLLLTKGQYLDISYEKRSDLTIDHYWPMVEGKTAALLAACGQIGAVLGGATPEVARQYTAFGRNLGLAFQVQDDILGIWGDETSTGKSAASDLVEGKNSLPILYGIGRKGTFAHRWAAGPVTSVETDEVAQMLKDEGAYAYCVGEAERLTELAMQSLKIAEPRGAAGEALSELAAKLLNRRS